MQPDAVTQVGEALRRVREGDARAGAQLFDLLQAELHEIARRVFRSQRRGHTLQPTALVNEAYVKFSRALQRGAAWEDRGHFLSVASQAMRQVVLNHARERAAEKRGGADRGARVTLSGVPLGDAGSDLDGLAVHEALEELAAVQPRQARLAELKFFAGLSHQEIADILGVSVRTVEVDWRLAKQWLRSRLA